MSKKTENLSKQIAQLTRGISRRNNKILRLLEENSKLKDENFELYCAVQCLDPHFISMFPYDGYKVPYVQKVMDINGIEWRRTEQTCKVEGCCAYTYDFSSEIYYEFEMQCGGSFDWNDEEPPSYCPNCGAKVVNDGQQLDEEDEG